MFSEAFEQEVIKAVREIVKDILQDEIKQDKRYNQKELCETLGIGVDTLSDLNKRGFKDTELLLLSTILLANFSNNSKPL